MIEGDGVFPPGSAIKSEGIQMGSKGLFGEQV